jgi:RNA polymerase sigma-70 factor (ECF subfamily)
VCLYSREKVLAIGADGVASAMIQQYYDRLTYVAFTYVRDQSRAEDLVQQTFMNAYLSIHRLKDPTRPFPWLVRIAINQLN